MIPDKSLKMACMSAMEQMLASTTIGPDQISAVRDQLAAISLGHVTVDVQRVGSDVRMVHAHVAPKGGEPFTVTVAPGGVSVSPGWPKVRQP